MFSGNGKDNNQTYSNFANNLTWQRQELPRSCYINVRYRHPCALNSYIRLIDYIRDNKNVRKLICKHLLA